MLIMLIIILQILFQSMDITKKLFKYYNNIKINLFLGYCKIFISLLILININNKDIII